MKKAEMQEFRERLVLLRARLRGDVSKLADSGLTISSGGLSSVPIHMADMGSDTFEQDFTISLMESGEGTLDAIEEALERIEDETYGLCTECEGKIPKERLRAIPYTPVCIQCATKLERR